MIERDTTTETKRPKWRHIFIAAIGTLALTACTGLVTPNVPNHSLSPSVNQSSVDLLQDSHFQLGGVSRETDSAALKVTAIGSKIVDQDGSEAYDNPQVNLYGTYLKQTGAFALKFTMSDVDGTARFSVYETPPFISDEVRAIDGGTVDVVVTPDALQVVRSDEENGQHIESIDVSLPSARAHTFEVVSDGSTISVKVDDTAVDKTLSGEGMFDTGTVWLGMDAEEGSFRVDSLTATAHDGGTVKKADSRDIAVPLTDKGFAALAHEKRPGFIIGTATALGPIVFDPQYGELLGNFNSLSTENVGKWQAIHPQPDVYDFAQMDAIVDIARNTGRVVHCHTLIFGEANPQWVQDLAGDKAALQKAAVDHITTIMKRYKGKVKSWDVLNEVLADYDTEPGEYGLRKNIWYETLGPDYLEIMLKAAHEADPDATLVINEFGMEADDERFEQMLEIVDMLQAKGIKHLAIGFQGHYDEWDTLDGDEHLDKEKLATRLKQLAKRGVGARFSEVDISNESEQALPAETIEVCLKAKNCEGVTVWVPTDKYTSSGTIDDMGVYYPGTGVLWREDYSSTTGVEMVRSVLKR